MRGVRADSGFKAVFAIGLRRSLLALSLLFTGHLFAQEPPAQQQVPVYRITVVARTTKAVNYRHRSGSTKVNLRGTPLAPQAEGDARVESKQGAISINAEMEHLPPASGFGPEYLTYVMWAITPEGRPTNIGEVLLDNGNSKLNTTTELQAFSLIVTAEPHFAVTQPSDVVVMENEIRTDTVGKVEEIEAKYDLLQRGQYTLNVNPAELKPIVMDSKVPLELYEARNAIRIARWTRADHYAADSYKKAEQLLQQAEAYQDRKAGKKPVAMTAREAAQTAEDARIISIKRQEEERVARENDEARQREARAKAEAEEQTRLKTRAEAEQRAEMERRATAEANQKVEAERRARAEAEQRVEAERRARAEAERAAATASQQAAQAEAERARLAAQQSDQLRQEADLLRQKAENEKRELRENLLRQLNTILETRDSERGLIVTMADVLFDTGKYTLKPGTREKLAKLSGIVLLHPGLKLEVEGHADNVGGDEYNQKLSEKRAAAVRDYLVEQGLPIDAIVTRGFGKTRPVVSNDTAEGRQRNRRVELIVMGEVIGTRIAEARLP